MNIHSIPLRVAASIAMLALLSTCTPTSAAERPNILLILVDDMGYGDLSCYGSKQISTPHIDALADQGVRCTQGYVAGSVCAPSRAGLMTGRYPNRFGFEHNLAYPKHVPNEWIALDRQESTMADQLKGLGYRTGLIGKWHLGGSVDWHHPNARGFDFFFGMLNGSHHYFPTLDKHHLWRQREPIQEIGAPYLKDWFTDEAISFMQQQTEEPWFLYLSYNTPHTPLQAKEEDLSRFGNVENKRRRTYCAMQRCLDENIGRITIALRDSGQFENTLIVFLSDNGGPCDSNASINAPLRGQKGSFLEGGVRVPVILRWGAQLPSGSVFQQPFIALDLLPTFLAAAGGASSDRSQEVPRPLDGVDLLPFLRSERGDERPHETFYWRMALRSAAIRDGDWKLVRMLHRPVELYDLSTDVSELNNLAASRPDKTNELMAKLNDWELQFKNIPRWMSGNNWMRHHRNLYEREYQLTQPE